MPATSGHDEVMAKAGPISFELDLGTVSDIVTLAVYEAVTSGPGIELVTKLKGSSRTPTVLRVVIKNSYNATFVRDQAVIRANQVTNYHGRMSK